MWCSAFNGAEEGVDGGDEEEKVVYRIKQEHSFCDLSQATGGSLCSIPAVFTSVTESAEQR